MDTSKKYIEMCEKAKEIKKLWQFRENDYQDYVVCKEHRCLIEMSDHYYCPEKRGNVCLYPSNLIWLPRRDQLQEMITKKGHFRFSLIELFYRFCVFDSMEQLWLVFVMKEKYNKVWNGKDWLKDKK